MKFNGELTVKAPRAAVYEKVRDARFFASCVDGVRDLVELSPDRYSAVFETKVAYMKFGFKVTVEVTRSDPPTRSRRRLKERRSASSPHDGHGVDTAQRNRDETRIEYEVDAALTGKLGSLGQPVLRSKAREMEKQFAARLAAAFAAAAFAPASPEISP